ncbi:hypothetical protein CL634_11290 [bacterium]|nr:hypothetical protein [bacterium]|tara:strand:- start:641 stop:928 length:288 start_codon:yes stop_codon:yes gene_type:complete
MKFKNAKGEKFDIEFRKPNKRFFGEDCDGYCTAKRVVINPDRTDQTQLNTIIHEVAHAFFWDKKEYEIKRYADTMSRLLYNELKWRKSIDKSKEK